MMRKETPLCRKLLAEYPQGPGPEEEAHLHQCDRCGQERHQLDWLRQCVLDTEAAVDDLMRARILTRLRPTFHEVAERQGTVPPSELVSGLMGTFTILARQGRRLVSHASRRPLVAGLVLTAVLLVLVMGLLFQDPSSREEHRSPGSEQTTKRILQPVTVRVAAPRNAPRVHQQAVDQLHVPAGMEVQAQLADRARLAVFGPATIAVQQHTAQRIDLRLDQGTLISEYDGRRGGRLLIHTPHTTVEIVGTLFAVEVTRHETRVSVAHGAVKVQQQGRSIAVKSDETWKSSDGEHSTVVGSLAALFARFSLGQPSRIPEQGQQATGAGSAGGRRAKSSAAPSSLAGKTRPRRQHRRASFSSSPSPASSPPAVSPASPAFVTIPTEDPSPAPLAAGDDGPQSGSAAEVLYRTAEQAMLRGDSRAAQRALEALLAYHDTHPLASLARYELALYAFKEGQGQRASTLLQPLLARRTLPRLMELARHLHCRIQLLQAASDPRPARGCLEAFRREYPTSPHDEAVLSRLIALTSRDCPTVSSLAREYLARYGQKPFAAQVRVLRAQCADAKGSRNTPPR